MVNIQKSNAPQSLSQYRREAVSQYGTELTQGNIFNDLPQKGESRTAIIQEQGYLCAYCMTRIIDSPLDTKVDHCHSQDGFPSEKLDYKNLLLCCNGNEGEKAQNQHCDTRKGGLSFSFNPSDPQNDMSGLIKYRSDGSIYSENNVLNSEINNILNLNYPRLKMNRKSILLAFEIVLNSRPGNRSSGEIRNLIDKYKTKNVDGELSPYYGVALYKHSRHHSLSSRKRQTP